MNIWNDKNLGFPPINTYKATNRDLDLQQLYSRCMEARKFFLDEKFMYAENLLLSKIMYRMKRKFRSVKEFKTLAKLHKALRNYFQMHLAKDLQTFAGVIPSRYKSETYLPNKNLLDYILLKFQGVVKLMERIVVTSQIAASLLEQRLSIGHFWKVTIILFALVSRIHVLAKYTANCVCENYRKLYPFSQQMRNNGTSILPAGYELCEDLKKWLNVDWLDLEDDIQVLEDSPEMPFIQFFNLADDDDDDDDDEDVKVLDEYIVVGDDDPDELEIVNSFKRLPKLNLKRRNDQSIKELRGFSQEDIGEVIEVADETITSNLFDSEHDSLEQFDQNESGVEAVSINDSVIEKQNEADIDVSSTEDIINISDIDFTESTKYVNRSIENVDIIDNIIATEEAEDVGEVVNILDSPSTKGGTHMSNLLGASEESAMYNFSVVEINDTNQSLEFVEDDSVVEIDKENQQEALDEAVIIDDTIINDQAEDVGEIINIETNKLDEVTDTDIVFISDTEINEKTAVRAEQKSVGLNRNRDSRNSNMNKLIEKIEKDKKNQGSRKVEKTSNKTNEVIEIDSLSDSSIIIIDELNRIKEKMKAKRAKRKLKQKKLKQKYKLQNQKVDSNPPNVSFKIFSEKQKGTEKKGLKKKSEQLKSNPNTFSDNSNNQNAKVPNAQKKKGLKKKSKLKSNPNKISNNSNNQNAKVPNVPSTSRISSKVNKKKIKLGKAGKEQLETTGRKRKLDQKTIEEPKRMKLDLNPKENKTTKTIKSKTPSTTIRHTKKVARTKKREVTDIQNNKSKILTKGNKRRERKLKRLQYKFKGM